GSYYAGHPCPIRANPEGAGLYTHFGANDDFNGIFRTKKFELEENDPSRALPKDWPPVPVDMANPVEGDFLNPGVNDQALAVWQNNTNGITEYTASNLGPNYKGNLFAVTNRGKLHRIELNSDGTVKTLTEGFMNLNDRYLLDVTAQGDGEIFAGTMWFAVYTNTIMILEPTDCDLRNTPACVASTDPAFDPEADYDMDGFTNADEIAHNKDYCFCSAFPPDRDGDFIGDRVDPDDDNDGVMDHQDAFQIDFNTNNGLNNNPPIVYDLFADTGFGWFGLGFTGIMTNGDPNNHYQDWVEEPGDSPIDDIYGGAAGIITIYQTDGDARNNNQEKAYQFGVNVSQNSGKFRVRAKMVQPFHRPTGQQSYGIFIGTGDQDNYIKLVMVEGGLQVVSENQGVLTATPVYPLYQSPTSSMDLYFLVDPLTGIVEPAYSIDNDGPISSLGFPALQITTRDLIKDAIQNPARALAVGVIGTTGGSAQDFAANYDFMSVTSGQPFVTRNILDVNLAIGSPSYIINLNNHFGDNEGIANLRYSITSNTCSYANTSIIGSVLSINFATDQYDQGDIKVRATDQSGNFAEQTFNIRITDPPVVMYRVNAGGPGIPAAQGLSWSPDTRENALSLPAAKR
ncbi:MAG: PKD domain-containing protein, partial [Bacteroidia bacterium]|nr:PKD domain-containing protein [Bacteroidia bacterium]